MKFYPSLLRLESRLPLDGAIGDGADVPSLPDDPGDSVGAVEPGNFATPDAPAGGDGWLGLIDITHEEPDVVQIRVNPVDPYQ